MDIVAADILSGLPVTDDGLRYILVLTILRSGHVLLHYHMPKLQHACV